MTLTKKCLYCGKEFEKPTTESLKAWNNRHKYCSRECYVKSMKGKNLFGKNRFNGINLKGRKFPERRGRNNPRWSRVELTCQYCGKKFLVTRSRKDTAKYCSRQCVYNARNLTPQNEKVRKSKKYKEWRKAVFERDNYTCQMCGVKNKKGLGKTVILHADHIKPFAYYPELRFDINNGRTLCEDCHKKTKTYGFYAWRNFRPDMEVQNA